MNKRVCIIIVIHVTTDIMSYRGILCHAMSYVTIIAASLVHVAVAVTPPLILTLIANTLY